MKRSHKLCFGLLLVFSIMFGSFLNVSFDVSALDAVTVPLPASGLTVCSSSTTPCSDYSYIRVSVSGDPGTVSTVLSVIADGFTYGRLNFANNSYALNSDFFFSIPSGISTLQVESNKSNSTLTYELLTSLETDCPVCEECQVCPALPENPYDDKFDKIIAAIYTCAAVCLVIYFFYAIYRMILGGR